MGRVIVQEWMTLDGVVLARSRRRGHAGRLRARRLHGLIDELRLMIDPLLVGGGKRLFRDGGALRPLRLVDSQVATTGAIIATYAPAEG
jgi:hypothetical protein